MLSLKTLVVNKYIDMFAPRINAQLEEISKLEGDITESLDVLAKLYNKKYVAVLAIKSSDIRLRAWGHLHFHGPMMYIRTKEDEELSKEMYKITPYKDVLAYIKSHLSETPRFERFYISQGHIGSNGHR